MQDIEKEIRKEVDEAIAKAKVRKLSWLQFFYSCNSSDATPLKSSSSQSLIMDDIYFP